MVLGVRDRIVGLRRVAAGELRAHPRNWRRHPDAQRSALAGLLGSVGIVGAVVARETDGGLELVDGHLRADVLDGVEVPVLVVDLDDGEAAEVLASLDPIGAMAVTDSEALVALLEELSVPPDFGPVADLVREIDAAAEWIGSDDNGGGAAPDAAVEMVVCPACGHRWRGC